MQYRSRQRGTRYVPDGTREHRQEHGVHCDAISLLWHHRTCDIRTLAIGVGSLSAFIAIVAQHITMFLVDMLVAIVAPLGVTFILAGAPRRK